MLRMAVAGLLLVVSISACETVSYYGQAVAGQISILSQRRKIESLIEDEGTDPALRDQLRRILEIRRFAETELGLPLENTFSTYVDVRRPYVVWNVFAAPEFSMEPVQWCYPVAGCASYRGYFSEAGARDFADNLEAKGYDVYVGGVAAYSTLGWFADPVLNTVVGREEHELATLIFHELAHQVVYIPGDTAFNESFATAVEQEGLSRWLGFRDTSAADRQQILDRVELSTQRREDFVSLVQDTVDKLDTLYSSGMELEWMRGRKREIRQELVRAYRELKSRWGGYDGYDNWFSRDLNNAQLSTVSTYFNLVPAFRSMLAEEGGDLEAFFGRAQSLRSLDKAERLDRLTSYLH